MSYYAHWSPQDNQWVGTTARYPSLSWLHTSPAAALAGIRKLAEDIDGDTMR